VSELATRRDSDSASRPFHALCVGAGADSRLDTGTAAVAEQHPPKPNLHEQAGRTLDDRPLAAGGMTNAWPSLRRGSGCLANAALLLVAGLRSAVDSRVRDGSCGRRHRMLSRKRTSSPRMSRPDGGLSCLSWSPVIRFRASVGTPGAAECLGRLAACDWPLACGLAAGVLLDAFLGDPSRGHPVAAFGRAAQSLQDCVYGDSVARGVSYTAICVMGAAAPAALAAKFTRGRPWLRLAATAGAAWTVLGAASLASEAERIGRALETGDLGLARTILPNLCGRDPWGLTEAELVRAVLESVAENASDAIVAPLLWGSIAGLPGLLGYRAVNTLDAMVGYRSARFARFGWASARLDDVVNWLPARLTGVLACVLSSLVGGEPAVAWRVLRADGRRHPSPNAGQCEAAFAGALDIRLGGTNTYAGVSEDRDQLGDGRAPQAADIARAVRLCRAITAAAVVVTAAAALLAGLNGSSARRTAR
jgi:adenosylcobinamide-phosphate synthase